jgi:hypothetical protein
LAALAVFPDNFPATIELLPLRRILPIPCPDFAALSGRITFFIQYLGLSPG